MRHLHVANLRKSYDGLDVVAGLDLEIEPGVCFGLLGPNGAGKTTTLRLCLGLTGPDSGAISMLGFSIPEHAREARARIGVVPQVDNLDPDFTVRENLLVYGRYFGLSQRVVKARIPELLEFGLSAREHARIQTLSGGMKRRLTLARALVNDPQLIFLDEPSTGLDPQHVISSGSVCASLRAKAGPSCSRRTSWTKRSDCAIASPLSITAARSRKAHHAS